MQMRIFLFGVPLQVAENVPLVLTRAPLDISIVPNSRPELLKLQVWAAAGEGQVIANCSITVLTIIVRMVLRVKVGGLWVGDFWVGDLWINLNLFQFSGGENWKSDF